MQIEKAIKRSFVSWAVAVLLAGCGGSDPAIDNANQGCQLAEQKDWLRSYMRDWYYWSGSSTPYPDRAPTEAESVRDYFFALLLPGEGKADPTHYWSNISDTAAFNRLFSEGKTLGYGLSVNGVEGTLPLKLRYVDVGSPAAALGLQRGDTVVSINGDTAANMLMAQDFHLGTSAEGQAITVVVDRGAGPQTFTVSSAIYALTPVTAVAVLPLAGGVKAGYLSLKDFISQAETPLTSAFTTFANAGATELILDLRYNGGGLVSTSNVLASLVTGINARDGIFAKLRFNQKQSATSDVDYRLTGSNASRYTRVVVLTGSRTCSASELVVNGLKPYVNVVTIGATSCGKPFGFQSRANCSSTFSAVNFESFNRDNGGRYYEGIPATCPGTDDFTGPLGVAGEKLTAAAISYLQTGSCPVAAAPPGQARALSVTRSRPRRSTEAGERQGMWAD